jgi:molybdopterin converting factor small subunit
LSTAAARMCRRADAATRLNKGDEVTLFPPMEGG